MPIFCMGGVEKIMSKEQSKETIYDWMNRWAETGQLVVNEDSLWINPAFLERIAYERKGYRQGENPDGWQIEMMGLRALLHETELAGLPWKTDKRVQELIDECWWMRWNLAIKTFAFDRKVDPEMAERYQEIIDHATDLFRNTTLLDSSQQVGEKDVELILSLFSKFDPQATGWRTDSEYNDFKRKNAWYLQDGSTFGNWGEPGGPMEHINLSVQSVSHIFEILKGNLKPDLNLQIKQEFEQINPSQLEAIMAFHDIGRLFTHTFFTTGVIGDRLLKSLRIRGDIIQNLPTEKVMLTPMDEDMDIVIQNLGVIAVIARLADEFGKRAPGTNRLYMPEDYNMWDRQKWADGYTKKQITGRPSDSFFRKNVQLHVDNVPRYFESLDRWVQKISTLTLEQLIQKLQERIGKLPPLPEKNS